MGHHGLEGDGGGVHEGVAAAFGSREVTGHPEVQGRGVETEFHHHALRHMIAVEVTTIQAPGYDGDGRLERPLRSGAEGLQRHHGAADAAADASRNTHAIRQAPVGGGDEGHSETGRDCGRQLRGVDPMGMNQTGPGGLPGTAARPDHSAAGRPCLGPLG